MKVDKAKLLLARAKEKAANQVTIARRRLTMGVLGDPEVYAQLGSDDKTDLAAFDRVLSRIENDLRRDAWDLISEARTS